MDNDLLTRVKIFEEACKEFNEATDTKKRERCDLLLQQFQEQSQPYEFCRVVLERKENGYACFMSANILRRGIVREWLVVSDNVKSSLCNFIINYLINVNPPAAVRNQLLHCFAVIMKRAWTGENGQNYQQECRNTVQKLLNAEKIQIKIIYALELLSTLVTEFSTQKSSEINMPWEFHEISRIAFQKDMLPDCFQVAILITRELSTQYPSSQVAESFKPALNLLLQVLSWDFSKYDPRQTLPPRRPRKTQSSILAPPPDWAPRISDTNLIDLLLDIHEKYRGNEMTQLIRQSLIQLASLSKRIFSDEVAKMAYLNKIISAIFSVSRTALETISKFVSNNTIQDDSQVSIAGQELYDCSQSLLRLITNFEMSNIVKLENLKLVLDQFSQLTFNTIMITTMTDDTWYADALDSLLDAWSVLALFKGIDLSEYCFGIFKCYVESRLKMQEDENEEEYLLEENLTSLAVLARRDLVQSLSLLNNLFLSQMATLQSLLERNSHNLDQVWDDIEWLLDFTGYILADSAEGESAIIPDEIIELSNTNNNNIFFVLISNIFKFAELESHLISTRVDILSSRIGERLMWFLGRWCETYLMPNMELYDHHRTFSTSLASTYGKNENGQQIALFFLKKIITNLTSWQSEPNLALETIKFFKRLMKNEQVQRYLVKTEEWKKLILMDRTTFQTLAQQGDDIKGALTECLVMGCDGIREPQELEFYLNELLVPLHNHFHELLTRNDFIKIYKNTEFMFRVAYCIEKLRGVARASSSHNFQYIWRFFTASMIFEKIVSLSDQYHIYQNMVNLCLQFYNDVCANLLSYLDGYVLTDIVINHISIYIYMIYTSPQCRILFAACLECIKTYRKYNNGRIFTGKYAEEAEEEQFTDVRALLQILAHMTSREFLDFGSSFGSDDKIDISEVIFQGMNLILPLITLDMLNSPILCQQFFVLTTHMFEVYPDRVAKLPAPLFTQLIQALLFGIKHLDSEINRMSYTAIACLGEDRCGGENVGFIEALMGGIFHLIMYEYFDQDLIEIIARALFSLISWSIDKYRTVVETFLLLEQQDQQIHQRLALAFNNLLNTITGSDKNNFKKFMKNLECFIFTVRAFLRRK
jgi:hypothetical protein